MAAGIVNVGGKVGGFDAYTTSNVLRGSGLSSSAAFEVCIGAILRGEYNDNDMEKFSQVKIAQIGQYAENVFFDKPLRPDEPRPPVLSAASSPSTSRIRHTPSWARRPSTWPSTSWPCASPTPRAATLT